MKAFKLLGYQKVVFILVLFALFLSPYFFYEGHYPYIEFQGTAMTVPYRLKIYGTFSLEQREKIEGEIEEIFNKIDAIYNPWNPSSEISFINRAEKGDKILLSSDLSLFLRKIDLVFEKSHHLFDPTAPSFPLLFEKKDWKGIHFEGETLFKEETNLKIDLCGIVKGFTVDLIAERIYLLTKEPLLFEWGGEIRVMGIPKGRNAWHIALWGEEGTQGIEIREGAIATSGSYFQSQKIKEGMTHSHLFHPLKRAPLCVEEELFYSVTVLAPTAFEADWIATVLTLFASYEEARSFIKERQRESSIEVILLDHQRKRVPLTHLCVR